MEHGLSQVALHNEEEEAKNTWRAFYRILMITLCLIITGLSASAVAYAMRAAQPMDISLSLEGTRQGLAEVKSLASGIQDVTDRIYKQTALETPLAILNTESTIMSALTSLSYQINNAANTSGCGAPVHDPDYVGGIGKELIVDNQLNVTDYHPSRFLEHLNFIPAPTTGSGCTRIPSFDMSATHYCYTHNVILSGCLDHSHSYQYLALGVLRVSATGRVFFSTLRSINLDDTANRKSCSVSATPLGCDMLCSKVTESESDDYNSNEPTAMIHGRLGFDGKYHEVDLNVHGLFSDWVANYAGVGGGTFAEGRVWFSVYGGLKKGSRLESQQQSQYVIYKRANDTCQDGEDHQIKQAKASYKPDRFGNRLIQQAILSIEVAPALGSNPLLSVTSNNITLMGAEGRVMTIGGKSYLYQRGSSYYSPAILYPLALNNGSATTLTPLTFDSFTRPGSPPCQATARCPNPCVTGVYTDVYPLIYSSNHTIRGVYGMMLEDNTARLDPVAAVFDREKRSRVTRVSSSKTKAAYTTSTCFRLVKTDRVYCLSIAEIANTLFGEFRIVPLLVEIKKPGEGTTRATTDSMEGDSEWSDEVMAPRFCQPRNLSAYRVQQEEYAFSWP
nr:hemagglutinin-neuraminidase protein [Orthoavulavirus sp.]